jgi:S1-C subfamily serine protease
VAVSAFQIATPRTSIKSSLASNRPNTASVAVKADELDKSLGLTPSERNVVNVHRVCSQSVVYVTSVLKPMGESSTVRARRRQRHERMEDSDIKNYELPRGTSLGSGSGFVIDSAGYIVTNYHVIQRAHEANQAVIRYKSFWKSLARNATSKIQDSLQPNKTDTEVKFNVESFINATVSGISGIDIIEDDSDSGRGRNLPAQVFVRFGTNRESYTTDDGSNGQALYHKCEIVDVVKELDVAVLKVINPLPSLKPLSFGSSADLLVGQSLLAIGNPFGLDRTITSGLVSAIGRSVTGVAGNEIKNCIQTDCAINPGVSDQ